jgi:hypothetical protein
LLLPISFAVVSWDEHEQCNLFFDGFPSWVENITLGVVGFNLIIHERIDQILLPQALEEILLAPALEHAMSNDGDSQIPTARHNRRLVAGLC